MFKKSLDSIVSSLEKIRTQLDDYQVAKSAEAEDLHEKYVSAREDCLRAGKIASNLKTLLAV